MPRSKYFFAPLLSLLLTSAISQAARPSVPQKFLDKQLLIPATGEHRFSNRLIETREFVQVKQREWKACHQNQTADSMVSKLRPFAAGESYEPIEQFMESRLPSRDLRDFERQGLTEGLVSTRPWSGDYWPYSNGILGARFMSGEFSMFETWLERFQFVQSHPAKEILSLQGQDGIPSLSPAEKYDLIIGSKANSFTQSMWQQGKIIYDKVGKVEEWMGICHGWAAAAIMEPRPVKSIGVLSLDQKWVVPLNPSEIKGLVSYSWAMNPFPSAFLGERCDEKNPRQGPNGRILNPDCFDLNPATWHLVIVNMVGRQHRSFIMDATFDYEVWNQPVVAYTYKYFNPQTGVKSKSLEKSIVSREDFTRDPYSAFRSNEARFFVGVAMKVAYVIENTATSDPMDSPEADSIRWVEYRYDLELNSYGEAIGGEWYLESHPDFIWVPKNGVRPRAPLEEGLYNIEWIGPTIPDTWAEAAQRSAPTGKILNSITEGLLKKSTE